MDISFFKSALKYHATLTILSVVILYLLTPMFNNINFISEHPWMCLITFIVAVNACLKVIFISQGRSNGKPKHEKASKIEGNKINRNKAKNISIITDGELTKNEINDNEASGDFIIGQGTKNGKK
ncbi:hypothetical protein F3I58_20465 [Pantoea sp. VH_4]|uniref:Uncharacterized protein n=1 Tax=Candidatus Pantoea gossypiicola TaxID=2608008 RepID=A0AB34CDT8_9GAMM|nr:MULTISPECIES: hypothetical protein [Pantoea]KAA5929539.1 hypothetical protein F3I58_20465 [Pantoea sp. VH_4]KAA5981385.1 hypothetical protein F3I49_19665 [Pantoea sp. M_4]KAA6120123.1 hypothetical protein F3I20_20295 [Pantoea gossypiicola]